MKNRYLHGPAIDQVLAEETFDSMGISDEVYWQLADNLGSVRDIVTYDDSTDTAAQAKHLTYGAFGNITSDSNTSIDVRFAYTGREFDIETGLYYYRARYYDAENGRFVSEDPIGFNGGDANLNRYVRNLITIHRDPRGLEGPYAPGGLPFNPGGAPPYIPPTRPNPPIQGVPSFFLIVLSAELRLYGFGAGIGWFAEFSEVLEKRWSWDWRPDGDGMTARMMRGEVGRSGAV